MADLALLENKRFVVLALLSTVFLVSVPFLDAVFSGDDPTGHGTLKKWKNKAKSTWQKSGIEKIDDKAKAEAERTAKRLKEEAERSKEKIAAEAKRLKERTEAEAKRAETNVREAAKKVEKEVKRTDDNWKELDDKAKAEAKRLEERTKAEAGRFGQRLDKAWNDFDNDLTNELARFEDRVKAEVNRIPDNIQKLGDKAKAEYERFLDRMKEELKKNADAFGNLVEGNVCDAYNKAQTSKLYDAKKLIYNTLMPPIEKVLQPHVATLVMQIAAPLNAIPLVGNVLYAMAVNPATIKKLTGQAAKEAINEALKKCK